MDSAVSKTEFRNAMARVCAPVNVITTDGPAGQGGFTATAMCSVTDEPPTLLICMNARSSQTEMFKANGKFCVNVLPAEHSKLAAIFAGSITDMTARFAAAHWYPIKHSQPALRDAIVSIACQVIDIHRVGTHNVMVGQVFDIRQRLDGSALLYFDRHYVHVPSQNGSFGG
ncbi:MAG: flavin reductase [Alphaproteobacteria bacterium]|nr:flavin reductase [Alphaproteobacteria bacterium]